jgi:hypothetical protein
MLILIFNISYGNETDTSSPQNQKSMVVMTEKDNSKYLSPEVTAAIFGALSGGLLTLLIKSGEWFFNRRMLNRILQKGLYFEIENHKIVELGNDLDGQPNFALGSFNDDFYQSNLSNISKILSEHLIQQVTFYYSHLKLAFDYQNDLFEVNDKIAENKLNRIISEDVKLSEERKGLKESIRLILATSQFIRINLLVELKNIFKEDPTKLKFIDVLPKYKKWFESMQKKNDV